MRPALFVALATACCIAQAAAPAAVAPVPSAPASAGSATTLDQTPATAAAALGVTSASTPALAPVAVPMAAAPLPAPAPAASAGSLLQTVLALAFVLALLAGLAWFMKRYGPKGVGANAAMRVVSSLSLGGRERIVLIEVADQWIVVGASPGRINALATLPRQSLPTRPDDGGSDILLQQNGLAATNFSEWLKQTLEKRNGK